MNFGVLRFFWYFRKKRFAHALAALPPGVESALAWQHYAFYRLGMYRSVAYCEPVYNSWRSLFAVIVSKAACGERDRVDTLLRNPQILRLLKPKMESLASALLAFYPDFSIRILSQQRSSVLQVAACMRIGDTVNAKAHLKASMANAERDSEVFLHRSNVLRLPPTEQLIALNKFLQANNVAPIALNNESLPVGAMNLRPTGVLPFVKGPLVSVVMTAFQSADRILFSIESLLNQTYQNIEVIVVDDASYDETRQVVEKLASEDPRVRYVRLPLNVGTYVAKSIGVHLTNGDFVTCQDSDDWAHPQKIYLQMAPILADEHVMFTVSNLIRVQDDGVFYARSVFPLTRINHSSVLFRKDIVFRMTGFWDLVRTGADSEFLARLKLVFGKRSMRRLSQPLSICAHRENSLMTAPATGYDKSGKSNARLDYWEYFSKWHVDSLRQGAVIRFCNNRHLKRPFPVPDEIAVHPADIENCMRIFGLSKL
ncbi:glycosyltransferase family 2 protein [Pantoea sp. 18069]|uniref:glycosyltransferase family 2 protein n=1 Tax=Pantoea sp. 18069 TaxID=2681415 RepID=UPI00135C79DC|nr:glycosyltransferase family 2 protein [Pantoea sp. 18069]